MDRVLGSQTTTVLHTGIPHSWWVQPPGIEPGGGLAGVSGGPGVLLRSGGHSGAVKSPLAWHRGEASVQTWAHTPNHAVHTLHSPLCTARSAQPAKGHLRLAGAQRFGRTGTGVGRLARTPVQRPGQDGPTRGPQGPVNLRSTEGKTDIQVYQACPERQDSKHS